MKYYWDTIDQCVPPDTILDVLRGAGFVEAERRVYSASSASTSPPKPLR